ncbi:MAG: hypothetical protein LH615_05150 [Ferruginibacter sp.]|nr:hypothetical protein [Ferruginibacter sp.]
MSINILEELRKNVGMPPLIKVDPNTQEVTITSDEEKENRLMQAIVPTAVAGIYDCARSEEGLDFLAGTSSTPDWLTLLFAKNAPEVRERLATYSDNTTDAVQTHFNSVAAEAVKILRKEATEKERRVSIRTITGTQRDWFLPYLPAELRIGKLLDDNTMDDRTNKMEGPVSSIMHKIETMITGQESEEDANKKRDEKM